MARKWLLQKTGTTLEESVFSAKAFYVSGRRWSSCVLRCGLGDKKPFTPAIKKVKNMAGNGMTT